MFERAVSRELHSEMAGAILLPDCGQSIILTETVSNKSASSPLVPVSSQARAPRAFSQVDPGGMKRYARLHRAMLDRGVYLAPSGYEVGFVSAAHSDRDIQDTIAAASAALHEAAQV